MNDKRLFSKEHIWVMKNGDSYQMGITEYALEHLGDIMILNLPGAGDRLEKDRSFGDIEGIKTVLDLISPVNGKVIRVNEELADEPGKIQSNPYENWLIQAEADLLPDDLMDEDAYLSCDEI